MNQKDNEEFIRLCENGDLTKVIRFVNNHPEIQTSYKKYKCLVVACQSNHVEIVKYLINEMNTDPSVDNNIAIREASMARQKMVVKLLMKDKRTDPSDYGNEAIRDPRVNMNDTNNLNFIFGNKNAIELASQRRHKRVVDYLTRIGVNREMTSSEEDVFENFPQKIRSSGKKKRKKKNVQSFSEYEIIDSVHSQVENEIFKKEKIEEKLKNEKFTYLKEEKSEKVEEKNSEKVDVENDLSESETLRHTTVAPNIEYDNEIKNFFESYKRRDSEEKEKKEKEKEKEAKAKEKKERGWSILKPILIIGGIVIFGYFLSKKK